MSVLDLPVRGTFPADHPGLATAMIEERDWSAHPLGDRAAWPEALTSALRLMLRSPLSSYLVWGEQRSFFFNDAYAPILEDRLPEAMGARMEELWADAWPAVEDALIRAEGGEAVMFEDLRITMRRGGTLQDSWWSFSYAPIDDAEGVTRGVMCVTTETTERVRAARIAAATDERNRQILDSATEFAIIATDLEGRVTRWNQGAARVLGWSEEEMLGQTLERCFEPEDVARDRCGAERRAAMELGGAIDEGWRLRRDGQRFWAVGQLTPIRDIDGTAIGFVKILRDRTARRLAAERLAASEAQLARALEALNIANAALASGMAATAAERDRMWDLSPDLLHVSDPDGVLRRVNPAWTTILGYTAEELVGTRAVDLLHPDDVPAFTQALAQIGATGSATAPGAKTTRENRVRHKQGGYRWFSWLSAAAPDGSAIYAAGRHITADRDREKKLRDTREFARLALGAIGGVGVWTHDFSTGLYYCDAAIADLYGIDPVAGALGVDRKTFLANVHPDDRAKLDTVIDQEAIRAGDVELEYRIVHPDGDQRWVLARGHTSLDATGALVRRTGIGVDMTRQRLIEEQLRHAQKVEAIGQLTGGVAHDFNNLLTVIRGSVDLLRLPMLSEARRKRYVDAISDTTDRATRLTGQLLAFARRQTLQPETFDARESVAAVRDIIETLVGVRVLVQLSLCDEPCFVDADRSQFDTALVNMAINARDAIEGEGVLTIVVRAMPEIPEMRGRPALPGPFVAVTLTDSGSGITADRLDRIFEPFFTTKAIGHGTGLGLSQVFGFARQSGGDILAESPAGQGASFTLYLPLVAPPPASDAAPAIADVPARAAGRCVLVVEDNPDVGAFATEALAALGFETRFAASAAAALEMLAQPRRIDVVFADVVMPGMSGIDLAEEVRRLYPAVPVVLTSGYSKTLAQSHDLDFSFVHKPYSVETLAAALQRVTERRSVD
jgi:PAS domain S-box-containing protein